MPLSIEAHFAFASDDPVDVLLQFEAAAIPEQDITACDTQLPKTEHTARVPAQDSIGERIWVRSQGKFEARYSATVAIDRLSPDLAGLAQLDMHDLPGEAVPYLFDSYYCPATRFQPFVQTQFGAFAGGAKAMAMHDWIADQFAYVPGSSTPTTTAVDSFIERRGICRDFAHVMVAFARAAGIPARFVSCYAPDVTPQDFHAVAELFLADATIEGGGAWYLVDATGMAKADEIAKIGIGRDAADVSFMTSFGAAEFLDKTIAVERG